MKFNRRSPLGEAAFTIVELMIATLIFSVILVIITTGIIHFTTDYYKGINTSATQTAARNIAAIIAQNLQYGGGKDDYKPNTAGGNNRYICIGSVRMDYNLGNQLTKGAPGNDYGVVITADNCGHGYTGATTKEYLGPNMRVTNLDVTQISGASNLYKISVGVAYGDIDLLCARSRASGTAGSCSSTSTTSSLNWGLADATYGTEGASVTCKSGKGSQFCAVSHLNTQVVSRFAPSP